jgi:hypothetical protein
MCQDLHTDPQFPPSGVELVDSVARLCCTNLILHGIGSDATHVPVMVKDALASTALDIRAAVSDSALESFRDLVKSPPPPSTAPVPQRAQD